MGNERKERKRKERQMSFSDSRAVKIVLSKGKTPLFEIIRLFSSTLGAKMKYASLYSSVISSSLVGFFPHLVNWKYVEKLNGPNENASRKFDYIFWAAFPLARHFFFTHTAKPSLRRETKLGGLVFSFHFLKCVLRNLQLLEERRK